MTWRSPRRPRKTSSERFSSFGDMLSTDFLKLDNKHKQVANMACKSVEVEER
jgi:hypothetical protein